MANNQHRLTGITLFSISGGYWDVVDDISYFPGGATREELGNMSGPSADFGEKYQIGWIKAKLRSRGNNSVADVAALDSAHVVVETASGKGISGFPMYCVEPPEESTAEASFTVTFKGPVTITTV